ncbi:uncharacterized protein RCC_06392 [Ramularia collo-cygni]|uniref:Ubiquitin-like domain-containing protein n=1 Tax=Ramularia collo-cygni TaxID=112498 RepID=A0A2D3USZ0_9PEZI|nr:uncharacterized protein RCC_06392 [Ramularia collo-cygni]CZT20532.1 uncharacterized protein RCC_06392 [Ramularia collo-cygni]
MERTNRFPGFVLDQNDHGESHTPFSNQINHGPTFIAPNEAGLLGQTGLPNPSNIDKEDNEPRHLSSNDVLGHVAAFSVQNRDSISITVVDSDGPLTYFKKSYKLGIKTNIKKALDQIRSHVCTTCSSPQMLEFWYETTELENGQTAALLGMQQGDTIDIHLKESCTRGAHPLPASQTTPNMHYLDEGDYAALIEETHPPAQNETVNVTFRNDTRFSMQFRLRLDQPISKACEAFEVRLGSPLKLENSDIIECYTEILGGGGAAPPPQHPPKRNATDNSPSPRKPLPIPDELEDSEELEPFEIIERVRLVFIDQYRHRLSVLVVNDAPLFSALNYASLRMGKSAKHVTFEIEGTRIDLEVLGTKTALDLGLKGEVEVQIRCAGSGYGPNDSLPPRSIKYGVLPPEGVARLSAAELEYLFGNSETAEQ